MPRPSLSQLQYGWLRVLGKDRIEQRKDKPGTIVYWRCLCVCGGEVVRETQAVKKGVSCGCRRTVWMKHGHAANNELTPEYETWRRMFRRCYDKNNKDYADYGGRGIRVCERWFDFLTFLFDMGDRPTPTHSLDRKDNDKGYSSDNCRWATKKEQAQNRRNVRWLTHSGKTLCVADWARELNLSSKLLYSRIKAGMAVDDVLRQGNHKPGPRSAKSISLLCL